MKIQATLTDREYQDIQEALEYASEHAVHDETKARFDNTRATLMRQYEEHIDD